MSEKSFIWREIHKELLPNNPKGLLPNNNTSNSCENFNFLKIIQKLFLIIKTTYMKLKKTYFKL